VLLDFSGQIKGPFTAWELNLRIKEIIWIDKYERKG